MNTNATKRDGDAAGSHATGEVSSAFHAHPIVEQSNLTGDGAPTSPAVGVSLGHDDKEGETETFTSRYGAETVPGDGKAVDRAQDIIEPAEHSHLEGSSLKKKVSSSLELEEDSQGKKSSWEADGESTENTKPTLALAPVQGPPPPPEFLSDSREMSSIRIAKRVKIHSEGNQKSRGGKPRKKTKPTVELSPFQGPPLPEEFLTDSSAWHRLKKDKSKNRAADVTNFRKKQALARIVRTLTGSAIWGRRQHALDEISEEKIPEDSDDHINHDFPMCEEHEVEEEGVDTEDAPGLTTTPGLTLPPARGTTIALGEAPPILPGAFAIAGPGESGTDDIDDVNERIRQFGAEGTSAEPETPPNDAAPLDAFIHAPVHTALPLANVSRTDSKRTNKKWEVFQKWKVCRPEGLFTFSVLVVVGVVVGVILMMRGSSSSPTLVPTHSPTIAPTSAPTVRLTFSFHPTLFPTSAPTVTSWLQVGSDINAVTKGDRFGDSVSLSKSGTRLATGAPNHDRAGLGNRGLVQVFQKDNEGNWVKLGEDLLGNSSYDYFGDAVSISGDGERLAVGAYGHDDRMGQVKVYQLAESGTWEIIGTPLFGDAKNDRFGWSVSLSMDGNIVAVGAILKDEFYGISNSGSVRVFQFTSNSWTQLGNDIDGEGANDFSGFSVSLSSDGLTVAIGAYWNDGESGENSGHVRIYRYENGWWTQVGEDIDGEAAHDYSGWSVSLSSNGTIVAVGARYNDGANGENSGHARVYQYDEEAREWSQLGNDIDGEADNDQFGRSVSLSSDGTVVAVGAQKNDGNGYWSGHVRIHRFDGNNWVQVGPDIDGEAAYDAFGYSVSLSGDGRYVAIGAPHNNAKGESSGQVRVFNWPKV